MRSGFDRFTRRARPHLAKRWGEDFAGDVLQGARAELARVAPEIPDIGGWRNVFTPVMTVNGWLVALHRAMAARGRSAADTIAVAAAVTDEFFRAIPAPVLRFTGWLAFTRPVRWFFERQAARSRERRHAEDFVYSVEVTDDGEFSLVFDECAVNKFYAKHDVTDLAPYCNFVDVTYSRLMGMGLDAQQTIGLGCSQCALRFKHGRATDVPSSLTGILGSR